MGEASKPQPMPAGSAESPKPDGRMNRRTHKYSADTKKQRYGNVTSVYLFPGEGEKGIGGWLEYRELCVKVYGKSGSARLNELMLEDLAQMKGQTVQTQASVSLLEAEVCTLISKGKKITGILEKAGVYTYLEDIATDWKLDFDGLGNVDRVVRQFLEYPVKEGDHFSRDDIELFIQLLTLAKEKTLKKKQLDEARINKLDGKVATVSTQTAVVAPGTQPEISIAPAVTSAGELIAPPKEIQDDKSDLSKLTEMLESEESEGEEGESEGVD